MSNQLHVKYIRNYLYIELHSANSKSVELNHDILRFQINLCNYVIKFYRHIFAII